MGEKINGTEIRNIDLTDQSAFQTWYISGSDRSITQTIYNEAPADAPNGSAFYTNLRNRVAATLVKETRESQSKNATYYSYDISGNAKTVIQEIAGLKLVDPNGGIKRRSIHL